jgi:hypothetical protein
LLRALYVGEIVLTENEVIEFVCSYLESNGYLIKQKLSTRQTGVDIIATTPSGHNCFVEAKGATSSKPGTSKFGKEFDKSQVKTHVGVALVAAFKALHNNPKSESIIALPNNSNHKSLIEEMRKPIINSGIGVLLVGEKGDIQKYI